MKMIGFLLKLKLWFFDNAVFYINGSETLPPPLSKAEEAAVIERIRSGDSRAREPLIVHNLRLVVYIAKKSRQLWDLGEGTLTIPESIDWAITDIPPKDLEHRKELKKQREYEQKYGLLDDAVPNIDDKDIRACVESSGLLSISQKRLAIDYDFDLDSAQFSRVRVIAFSVSSRAPNAVRRK